jgi:DNA end-binding protein Ku
LRLSLVSVPIKAYPAVVSHADSHLHQLHTGCGQRIRYAKHCPVHGPVDAGGIVSGFSVAPDQYVVVEEAELEALRPAKDRALLLEQVLDAGSVDPMLFAGRTLYLLPEGPAAQQPYLVLRAALQQHGLWALGRLVLNGRRQLGVLRPVQRVLALHLLHFPAQLRSSRPLEAEPGSGAASAQELHLAGLLLEASRQPVAWSDLQDDSAERLRRLLEAKLQGQSPSARAVEETPVLRLLDALQQSVAQALDQTPATASSARGAGQRRERSPRRPA